MRLLGFNVTREKAAPPNLSSVPADRSNGWWPIVRESFTGAWQRNVELFDTSGTFHADFACRTLIARDIAKLRVMLVEQDDDGVWTETQNNAYSPVLRKPNSYQTRNQFWESWILSKLSRGNTYVLKERDNRNVVVALYVLDPTRVKPLEAPDGSVFYELRRDWLSGVQDENVIIPASEIIHDRMNCLFHPLVGIAPIFANGLAASQGLHIQRMSATFFGNAARPSGFLTAPDRIPPETAERIHQAWNENYSGQNAGKTAVLGDGLDYKQMTVNAADAQLIEQLKWTAEVVCSTYHVPPYKIGVGAMPGMSNIQSLNVEYYSQCLQSLIEEAEECLDNGLGIGWGYGIGTEFDTENLLRMDSVTQMTVLRDGVGSALLTPDEGRKKLSLRKVIGGNSPYLQQQNYSLAALAKRDAGDDPFGTKPPPAAPSTDAAPAPADKTPTPPPATTRAVVPVNDGSIRIFSRMALEQELLGDDYVIRFDESQHPRAGDGKFTDGGGGSSHSSDGTSKFNIEHLSLSDHEVEALAHALGAFGFHQLPLLIHVSKALKPIQMPDPSGGPARFALEALDPALARLIGGLFDKKELAVRSGEGLPLGKIAGALDVAGFTDLPSLVRLGKVAPIKINTDGGTRFAFEVLDPELARLIEGFFNGDGSGDN